MFEFFDVYLNISFQFSNFISYRLFLCSENSFEIELRATVTSIASHEIRLS
ncbi:unnamed protein product [Callosobruchus maculatus]|uniref:Uncharacterized protein n=1 Tax=Callosobruchus maculatus TaxID=64391 RepID=A0A653DB01_CALMS|nr:unnamed protein product [Callosobruchus maculatus]